MQSAALSLIPGRVPDLPDVVDSFLEELHEQQRTQAAYRSALNRFLNFLKGTPAGVLPLAEIDFATVNDFLRHERASGAKDSTVNHRLAALRSFFRWAGENRLLSEDPSADIDFRPVRDREEAHFLDASELDRLFQTCDRNTSQGKRDYAMLRILADCGLRAAELRELDLEDVDFKRGALFVRNGKGGKQAWVYFNNEQRKRSSTRTAIKEWLEERPICADKDARQPLFVTRNRTRFTNQSIWSLVKEAARQSRLPIEKAERITPHTLRHSYVTRVWEKTGDIALTAKAARHSSPHTTLSIYTHIRDERLKNAAKELWE